GSLVSQATGATPTASSTPLTTPTWPRTAGRKANADRHATATTARVRPDGTRSSAASTRPPRRWASAWARNSDNRTVPAVTPTIHTAVLTRVTASSSIGQVAAIGRWGPITRSSRSVDLDEDALAGALLGGLDDRVLLAGGDVGEALGA